VFLVIPLSKPVDTFDLRQRYGNPLTERFSMRPDVTLAVSYGTDGKACVLDLEPRKEFLQESSANEMLTDETLDQLLEEIVPKSSWGKETLPSIGVSGSCMGQVSFSHYENIDLTVSSAFCEGVKGVHGATVHFKRSACSQWYKPPVFTPTKH
jgi:hypothetical protein